MAQNQGPTPEQFTSNPNLRALADICFQAHRTRGGQDRLILPQKFDHLEKSEQERWEWAARSVLFSVSQNVMGFVSSMTAQVAGAPTQKPETRHE